MKFTLGLALGLLTVPFCIVFPHTENGRKRLKKVKTALFVGNHLGVTDVLAMTIAYGKQINHIAKKELLANKPFGPLIKAAGVIGIDRGNADLDAMRAVFKSFKNGTCVGMFPEGTRNKVDNRLMQFRSGASMFAIKAKVPVVPFVYNKKPKLFKTVDYVIGDPIDMSAFYDKRLTSDVLDEADAYLIREMLKLKRVADYLGTLKGKARRALRKMLCNAKIDFKYIYATYESKLFPLSYSAQEACLEQAGLLEKAE